MPYKSQLKNKTRSIQHKNKIITKNHRNNTKSPIGTYESPEKEFNDENTMSDSPAAIERSQRKAYSHSLLMILIKHLHSVLHYGKDTLYVSLQLLNRLKIQIEQHKCKLYAATLLQMAAKVHEFRTPRYSDLVAWGNYNFSRTELAILEGQLLIQFNFKIPVSIRFQSIKHAEEAIRQLEMRIGSPHPLYTFQ